MHKLQALVPLLGWFYIPLIVYGVCSWVTKGRLKRLTTMFLVSVSVYAAVLSLRSIYSEVALWKETQKTLFDRFDQKIAYEAGEYYSMYYRTFRPRLERGTVVTLMNASTREYHYARMYLYPASVVTADALPSGPYVAILNLGKQEKIPVDTEILATYQEKYLIRKGKP